MYVKEVFIEKTHLPTFDQVFFSKSFNKIQSIYSYLLLQQAIDKFK